MSTNDVLLEHLVDLLDNEPPEDAGQHPSLALHAEIGDQWAAWNRRVRSVRTLLAPRLVDAALADYRQRYTPSDPGDAAGQGVGA